MFVVVFFLCRTSTKPDVASVDPILEINGKGGKKKAKSLLFCLL